MLFNSYAFLLCFLPISLTTFYQIAKQKKQNLSKYWLILVSLIFYGWWQPSLLFFLAFSISINYGLSIFIIKQNVLNIKSNFWLTIGVFFNLFLLGYFKYFNFFVESFNYSLNTNFSFTNIIVPLGISFITFEQISYLVDASKGKNSNHNFLNYCLFITFFPKLVSGPIIRYKELIPQFTDKSNLLFDSENISVGITIFTVGMFKKLVFADRLAPYTLMIYSAAGDGVHLTFAEAWIGVLALYLQLYFDFSGYSDMAIGVARMFGIKLPLNFDSPYKASNINQFWTRWHMSLTRFFRDYLYFPLSKKLKTFSLTLQQQTVVNIMITMTLTGIWHGSGWNFLIWGALHGLYLSCYQIWRNWRKNKGWDSKNDRWWYRLIAWGLTFFAWTFALVLAKTKTLAAAVVVWRGMLGLNGISIPPFLQDRLSFLKSLGIQFDGLMPNFSTQASTVLPLIFILMVVVWFTPNTQQWMGQYSPALDYFSLKKALNTKNQFWQKLQWQPKTKWAITITIMTIYSLHVLSLSQSNRFIYFNF